MIIDRMASLLYICQYTNNHSNKTMLYPRPYEISQVVTLFSSQHIKFSHKQTINERIGIFPLQSPTRAPRDISTRIHTAPPTPPRSSSPSSSLLLSLSYIPTTGKSNPPLRGHRSRSKVQRARAIAQKKKTKRRQRRRRRTKTATMTTRRRTKSELASERERGLIRSNEASERGRGDFAVVCLGGGGGGGGGSRSSSESPLPSVRRKRCTKRGREREEPNPIPIPVRGRFPARAFLRESPTHTHRSEHSEPSRSPIFGRLRRARGCSLRAGEPSERLCVYVRALCRVYDGCEFVRRGCAVCVAELPRFEDECTGRVRREGLLGDRDFSRRWVKRL